MGSRTHGMGRINGLKAVFCLGIAAGLPAGLAEGADRFWVAPLIGTWSDTANWSLSSGGPGGQGLPMGGDRIFMNQRSIAIFSGAGAANPNFSSLEMSGTGQGSTQLNMGSGAMGIDEITVGANAAGCELLISNAQLVSDLIRVGSGINSTDALLRLDGAGLIDTLSLKIGNGFGVGSAELNAGTLRVVDLTLGINQPHAGLGGSLEVGGGTLDAENIVVGEDGDGLLVQTGGHIEAETYMIGTTSRPLIGSRGVYQERAEHLGGTVDASRIILGRNRGKVVSTSRGEMALDGSDITTLFFIIAGVDSYGELLMQSGSIDTTVLQIGTATFEGQSYRGEMYQSGGDVTSGSLILGPRSLTPGPTNAISMTAIYELSGGTSDHSIIYIGQGENAEATMHVHGDGSLTTGTLELADDRDCEGTLIIRENGMVECDSLIFGSSVFKFPSGIAHINIGGGTLNADTVLMRSYFDSMELEQSGGVFAANRVEARGGADYSGGITAVGSLLGGYYETMGLFNRTSTQIRDNADFRTPEFRHNTGPLEFGPGSPVLSGPLLGPPFNSRTAGMFSMRSAVTATADQNALFRMNVTNTSTLTVESGAYFPVEGTFTNYGDIVLNGGTLSVTSPIDHANDAIAGTGTIDADLHNNATLEPTIMTITGSLSCGPDSVTLFLLGTTGSTTLEVLGPGVTLGGEVRLDFITGAVQPLPGTEYEIISMPNAAATGVFDSVVFEGAAVPAEVVYETGRVLVRVLYCSRADLAEPYGVINFFDLSTYLDLYDQQNPIADLAAPFGTVNFFDVSAYISLFNAGCP